MTHGWTYYQFENLAMVPYMPQTPVYRDGVLPHLYFKTKEEGHLEAVFHESGFNLDKFVAFFEKRKTMQVLCEVSGEEKELKPVGYSWVDSPSGQDGARTAICGFCFFREGKLNIRDLGRLGVAYWCEDLRIDVIHGTILEWNTPAVNYAKRIGFKETAYVPKWRGIDGELVGIRVVTLEAKDYLPGFYEWKLSQKAVAIKE